VGSGSAFSTAEDVDGLRREIEVMAVAAMSSQAVEVQAQAQGQVHGNRSGAVGEARAFRDSLFFVFVLSCFNLFVCVFVCFVDRLWNLNVISVCVCVFLCLFVIVFCVCFCVSLCFYFCVFRLVFASFVKFFVGGVFKI